MTAERWVLSRQAPWPSVPPRGSRRPAATAGGFLKRPLSSQPPAHRSAAAKTQQEAGGRARGRARGGGPPAGYACPAQRLVRPCSSPCTPPPRLLGQAEGTFLPPPVPPSAPRCCSRGRSCRKPPTHTGGRAARGCPGGSSQSPVSPPLREEGQVGGGPEADLLWCCGRQAQPPRTQRLDLRPNPSFEGSNPSLFFPRCPQQFGQWDGPSLGPHLLGGCPSLGRSLRPPPARAAPGDRGP